MRLGCVSIYKDGSDCTLGGLSSKCDRAVAIWNESIEDILKNPPNDSAFVIVEGRLKGYLRAIPLDDYLQGEKRWLMNGGNFLYTCDSRFPSKQPIAIHDRHEG